MKTEKIIKRLLCLLVFFIFIYCAGSLKAATLNVRLRNRSDSRAVTNLTFDRAGTATAAAPWVMADQYIEVEYAPDSWASYDWGLAIVTDNIHDISTNIAGKPTDSGPDLGPDGIQNTEDDWGPGPDGLHGTPDDDNGVTYGGLIDRDYVTRTPIRNQDPNFKASLCWQVYRDRLTTTERSGRNRLDTDNCLKGRLRSGAYTDSYNYNSDWAYIIDKKDSAYAGGVRVSSYDTATGLFYDTTRRTANKYFLVAWGTSTTRPEGTWGVLAQHPVVSGFFDSPNSKMPNDNRYIDPDPEHPERDSSTPNSIPDIVIYLGARFCVTKVIRGSPVTVSLPAGNYGVRIYLELLHF